MAGQIDDDTATSARDILSYVYYGVGTREAVALRLFGAPRAAAPALARTFGEGRSTEELRQFLATSSPYDWTAAMGNIGQCYYDTWKLVEPVA